MRRDFPVVIVRYRDNNFRNGKYMTQHTGLCAENMKLSTVACTAPSPTFRPWNYVFDVEVCWLWNIVEISHVIEHTRYLGQSWGIYMCCIYLGFLPCQQRLQCIFIKISNVHINYQHLVRGNVLSDFIKYVNLCKRKFIFHTRFWIIQVVCFYCASLWMHTLPCQSIINFLPGKDHEKWIQTSPYLT